MGQFDLDNALAQVADWRDKRDRIVFTNGVFDLLHVGHVRYLAEARELGDRLVVGVNSDTSVRRLKGPDRPLNPQEERAEIVAALTVVDAVVIFGDDTPIQLIEHLRPDVHVKGGDYQAEALPETPIVEAYGGTVLILKFVEGRSSSSLVERIQELK